LPKKSDSEPQFNQYARYSGLGFQMIATILAGLWLGMKTDHWLGFKNPVFTVIFVLIFIIASLIILIKGLPKS
jgi:ATP synthase protein I